MIKLNVSTIPRNGKIISDHKCSGVLRYSLHQIKLIICGQNMLNHTIHIHQIRNTVCRSAPKLLFLVSFVAEESLCMRLLPSADGMISSIVTNWRANHRVHA